MPLITEIIQALRRIAPPELAESWDNVGLLVGDASRPATRVMTCLTLTVDVADEAIAAGVELIVSHHPVLFRPVQRITAADPQGAMLLRLIAAGIAVYSPHTAYDSAARGINQQLAELFELRDVATLRPANQRPRLKLVTFAPNDSLESVRQALWSTGAGQIGEYSRCSFSSAGTGTFQGSEETRPAIGRAGRFERTEEIRLEVVCDEPDIENVIAKLRAAHPYEEPAYDVYPLRPQPGATGGGRCGTLSSPCTLDQFLTMVKQRLSIERLQFVGDSQTEIRRVAVACGAAAEFLGDAAARDCQVLFTGEARFHDCLKARDLRVALVLPGHYASERPGVERLSAMLTEKFADATVWPSRVECDPLRWV